MTGAGISAESGIATYRGPGGLWKKYRAEDLATIRAFERDPTLVWEWYDERRTAMAKADPNAGHLALADLEKREPGFTLITQNIDGLHDRAGNKQILKVHGDIWVLRCLTCGQEGFDGRVPLPDLPPRCGCGGMLRPSVVWFGEALPQDVWMDAEDAVRSAEVLLVVGTSATVYPAAGLIDLAKRAGAKIIEVNLEETGYSWQVDFALRGKASEILPELL